MLNFYSAVCCNKKRANMPPLACFSNEKYTDSPDTKDFFVFSCIIQKKAVPLQRILEKRTKYIKNVLEKRTKLQTSYA